MDHNSEKWLEPELVRRVKNLGGECPKWESPGNKGVSDRLVLLPGARIYIREVKSLGKTPSPLQKWWLRRLRELGFDADVIDSEESLNKFTNGL